MLRTGSVARLAVVLDGHPEIFPVNYAVDSGTVVFRTAGGSKLDGALQGPVALEVDNAAPGTAVAWSVVVKGSAQLIQETDELIATHELELVPWQAGYKGRFVRVTPTEITGRRFGVVG